MTNGLAERMLVEAERIPTPLPGAADVRRAATRTRRVRRTAWTVVAAIATAGTIAIASSDGLERWWSHTVQTVTHPPSAGSRALAADPLLTGADWDYVRAAAATAPMEPCLASASSWGATGSRSMRYLPAGPSTEVPQSRRAAQELVLGFDTTAQAHRAVTEVWHQFRDCPLAPEAKTLALTPPGPVDDGSVDEQFTNQRSTFATTSRTGRPTEMYSLLVARRGNVVVIVEQLGTGSDRAQAVLNRALDRAISAGNPP